MQKMISIKNIIKKTILLLLFTGTSSLYAQNINNGSSIKNDINFLSQSYNSPAAEDLETDFNIDVRHYNIDIDIDINNEIIDGSVVVEFKALSDNLDKIKLNLRNSLSVTAVTMDAVPVIWNHTDHILEIMLDKVYQRDEEASVKIFYNGNPETVPVGDFEKGFLFMTQGDNVPLIVNLSTPYLSHLWFPCKDGPTDKADDGMQIKISIPDVSYGGHKLKAVSNGLLISETNGNGKREFIWEHNHPIAPYYILVAVSNYQTIEGAYNNNNQNFPLFYHTFPQNYSQAQQVANSFHEVFDIYNQYFGEYPFKNEAYSMTQIPFVWAIENQTNSIIGGWSSGWDITMVHELSHMWFGNSITNQTWQHIWLNEGFATYAEALYYEETEGIEKYHEHMQSMQERFNWRKPLYREDDSDFQTLFEDYYYKKGAWVLHMLRGYIGDDTVFFNLIKSYAQSPQFKYGYITTDQFKIFVEDFTGLDLTIFFDQWVYGMSFADYDYNFISDISLGKAGLTISQVHGSTFNERDVYEMYFDVKIIFEDGTYVTERIFNNEKIQSFYFDIEKEVDTLIIDPDMWVLRDDFVLDTDLDVPPAPVFENKILSFIIEGQTGDTEINHNDGTIAVLMPYGSNLTSLAPTIELSANATVHPASNVEQNFTLPVVYTVTAEDGHTTKEYSVAVTHAANTEALIKKFSIDGQVGETVIDDNDGSITVIMPFGTVLTSLTPTIELSDNASVDPASGVVQDFSEAVVYIVTAEDGHTTKEYSIAVSLAPNTEALIKSFYIDGQVGDTEIDDNEGTIAILMPFGTVLTSLTPTIELSDNATVVPESDVEQDFTSPVTYTVTAEDGGRVKEYSVAVTHAANTEALITEFIIDGQLGDTVIDDNDGSITVIMPFGTVLTSIAPTIELSAYATVQPASGVEQNFTLPVIYTVTAEDGHTTKEYTITVNHAANTEALITAFHIDGQVGETVIDDNEGSITILMPYGTVLTSIAPTIELSYNATVHPASNVEQNFTSTVTYTVTAEDGVMVKEYSVTVSHADNTEALIKSFYIDGQVGDTVIDDDEGTIAVLMPFGTVLTSLTPTIELSHNATVVPASAVEQDFSDGIVYTVTAEDGLTTKKYSVTVTHAANTEALITKLSIDGQVGETVIDDNEGTIAVVMPYGTILTSLAPFIELSDNATVVPESDVEQDFTSSVTYTVTAEDGHTTKEYSIAVTHAPNTEALITGFSIAGQVGETVINGNDGTIAVLMPYGSDLTSLTPTIELSANATVVPASGVEQNFTLPVIYTVTAEDGHTTKEYTITVNHAANTEALITAFHIDGQVGETVIDDNEGSITILMPYGTVLTSIAPTIELSYNATVHPASDVEQNFTSTITYTVTAEDGHTTKDYSVTVNHAANTEALITGFFIDGQVGETVIDDNDGTIAILMPFGAVLTSLTPTIELSHNATVVPASNVEQNFTSTITYTVTAEDGLTNKEYSVTVNHAANTEALITKLSIDGQVGETVIDDNEGTIAVVMPYGYDLTSLTPTIELSENATVVPESDVEKDFTSPVTYTVTAEDGHTTKQYSVAVNHAANTEALITGFSIAGQVGETVINGNDGTIAVLMPFGTVLISLTPTIELSDNATVVPASGVVQDFSEEVVYTVTAEDGHTTKEYTVAVTHAPNTEALITAFHIDAQVGETVINDNDGSITILMPYGTVLTSLAPTIELSDNATVDPANAVVQDFSEEVVYTVTAQDGLTTKEYTVTVTHAANTEAFITGFNIDEQVGETVIDDNDGSITVIMPFGTILTSLAPFIELSDNATVVPESDVEQDFTSTVTYTVTAEDGLTTKDYSITVSHAPNTEALIKKFSIAGQVGDTEINHNDGSITVIMPFGTVLTSIAPTIELSAYATVQPASGVEQNFTLPVIYTVTAEDGHTTKEYSVTVNHAANTEALITKFIIDGQVGETEIDNDEGTIVILMPYGTVLTSLTPTIELSDNATVVPASDVEQDFTSSVTYTVTAEDGLTTKEYSVTVTHAPNTEALITEFSIDGQLGDTEINDNEGSIAILMPYGTNLTSLTPTIELSDHATVEPASDVEKDFSDVVVYTVTAEDELTTKEYSVTVSHAPNTEALITAFHIDGQVGETVIDDNDGTIAVLMPYGTVLTGLAPTIELSDNATVQPASGVEQNFSSPVSYTVTAEDGHTTKEYFVTVTHAANTEAFITKFIIAGQVGETEVNDNNGSITILMPYGSNLTKLPPIIELSDHATVVPTSDVEQNFTSPVTYTVTAEDGLTTKEYTVTVNHADNTEALITKFIIDGQVGETVIDDNDETISILMSYGADLTSLTPTIELSDNATVVPASGVVQDFTLPVTYTVTAEDGVRVNEYSVAVKHAANTEALITKFIIAGQVGETEIDEDEGTIAILMPFGSNLTSLTPTIELSDNATVVPESDVEQDFSDVVVYTVTAEDGLTTKKYSVTVTHAANTEALITGFHIDGQVGETVINDNEGSITVIMPFGTVLTSIAPTIELSDNATVVPASDVEKDFSDVVVYTVTAEDGVTEKEYTVTVEEGIYVSLRKEKEIQIQVYPNPTTDIVKISSSTTIKSIEIFSVNGKSMGKIMNVNTSNYPIKISDYGYGLFLLKIKFLDGQETIKKVLVVKE